MKEASDTVIPTKETLLQKLVTKEDPLHVHKALGILCIISFLVRFSMAGQSDMGFKTHPEWTWPTVLLHLLLNLSAYEFKIPNKRISSGYRIWPQYRNHSLAFSCRSLVYLVINWYEQVYQLPRQYLLVFLCFYVGLMAADVGTYAVPAKYRSNSVRELDVPVGATFFFSSIQIFVIAVGMFGLPRSSMWFFGLMVIQGNAFLMTMRRKNVAGHHALITVYGVWLVLGYAIVIYEMFYYGSGLNALAVQVFTGCLAILCRTGPRVPILRVVQNHKYLMWLLFGAAIQVLRPDAVTDELLWPWLATWIRGGAVASVLAVMVLGIYRSLMPVPSQKEKRDPAKKEE